MGWQFGAGNHRCRSGKGRNRGFHLLPSLRTPAHEEDDHVTPLRHAAVAIRRGSTRQAIRDYVVRIDTRRIGARRFGILVEKDERRHAIDFDSLSRNVELATRDEETGRLLYVEILAPQRVRDVDQYIPARRRDRYRCDAPPGISEVEDQREKSKHHRGQGKQIARRVASPPPRACSGIFRIHAVVHVVMVRGAGALRTVFRVKLRATSMRRRAWKLNLRLAASPWRPAGAKRSRALCHLQIPLPTAARGLPREV